MNGDINKNSIQKILLDTLVEVQKIKGDLIQLSDLAGVRISPVDGVTLPGSISQIVYKEDRYEVWETIFNAGTVLDMHIHIDNTEMFNVISGELHIIVKKDREYTVVLKTTESFIVPPNIYHSLVAITDVKMITIVIPPLTDTEFARK